MTDVFNLLTLPKTSHAFSALSAHSSTTASTRDTSRSASPPRKIARLDLSSDTQSASSSSLAGSAGAADPTDRGRPIILRIIGHPVKPTPQSAYDADYALVRRTVKILLTPEDNTAPQGATLPATYDRISRACRAVVAEAGKGEGLYDVVKMELERCVGQLERMLVNDPRKSVEWLIPFTEHCAWFQKQVALLQSLLAYLDTLYAAEKNSIRIKQLAYAMFTNAVIRSAHITQAIVEGLADWLEAERQARGEHDLRQTVVDLVQHMYSFGLYDDIIESTYLNLTHAFYTKESNDLVEQAKSAAEFISHHDARLKEESERAKAVLLVKSVPPVKDTAQSALVTGRLPWLAKDALKVYFEEKNKERTQNIYKIFSSVGGLKVLSAAFKSYVQQYVKEIVTDTERDEEMVQRLLDFKAFADDLVQTVFVDPISTPSHPSNQPTASSSAIRQDNPIERPPNKPYGVPNRDFSYGLIDAFQAGFKARRNKPAEMIAKQMDKELRRGQKEKRDEEYEGLLDRVLALYRFTDDMDVFRTFYQRALAKRLLLGRSASDDFEKAVLKKLKEQYDPEFGMGDHMFNDLSVSRELMNEFLKNPEKFGGSPNAQKLNVMVLQRSSWPFAARQTNIDLPSWMQKDLDAFLAYYKSKYKGRKLDWDHALGTVTMKARFTSGEKELSVSLHQAVILLLFNDNDELSYTEIKDQTRLDNAELQRTLQSLALGKKRVLRKTPLSKDVKPGDTFRFAADFTDNRYQIHINSIQAKETAEETKRTQSSIEQDRKHALDAAIVRVMKGKKELTYEQLKTATIEAVKRHFVPEVSMIKKRIEGLVEQEYLRRDDEDKNRYFYVA
ncbi:Cullin-domain-containing protein [Earliella scabrosa]|nr:Cullin-domain-containing protein [Earliella scabrosa]